MDDVHGQRKKKINSYPKVSSMGTDPLIYLVYINIPTWQKIQVMSSFKKIQEENEEKVRKDVRRQILDLYRIRLHPNK